MTYGHFFSYNVIGGIAWVTIFVWGGYFFGTLPFVQENFSLVVIAIVLSSILPALFEVAKEKLRPAKKAEACKSISPEK